MVTTFFKAQTRKPCVGGTGGWPPFPWHSRPPARVND